MNKTLKNGRFKRKNMHKKKGKDNMQEKNKKLKGLYRIWKKEGKDRRPSKWNKIKS